MLFIESIIKIEKEVYTNYFELIQQKYRPNPYHNSNHAADVTCSAFYFIMQSELINDFENIDNLAVLIACFGHDVAHPGLNNRFLINNREVLATTYNDVSVLENMHSALTFTTMNDKKVNANILENLP